MWWSWLQSSSYQPYHVRLLTSLCHDVSSPSPVQYAGLRLSNVSRCRSRRFAFILVCSFFFRPSFSEPNFFIAMTNRFAKNRYYVEGLCVMVLQGLHRGWVNMKSKLGELKEALTLWTKSLKTIEGKHPRILVSCYMAKLISFHMYVSQNLVVWFTLCTSNKRVLC